MVTEALQRQYDLVANTPSDINEHIPVLKKYALMCDIITELGVRTVVSTWAFLAAKPKKLISVDIEYHLNIENAKKIALDNNINFTFINSDDLKITLEPTDLLFIDTWHEYNHLKKELLLHADKAKKYIIFHDTVTFKVYGMPSIHSNLDVSAKGIWPAIEEFLNSNKNWKILEHLTNNNGLTILERTNAR